MIYRIILRSFWIKYSIVSVSDESHCRLLQCLSVNRDRRALQHNRAFIQMYCYWSYGTGELAVQAWLEAGSG